MNYASGGDLSTRTVEKIIGACGIIPAYVRHIGTGAQSQVWLVESTTERFTLRVGVARAGEANAYESEFALRRQLLDRGGHVAKPLFTNLDIETGTAAWSLDEYVVGSPVTPEMLTSAMCREIGELLAKLHSLPVEGFGLLQNRRDRLVGRQFSRRDGILDRLDQPWPFTGAALEEHPIVLERPESVQKLRCVEPLLVALTENDSETCVLHSDLHRGQFLFHEGRLAALLDFGDATAGPRAWDIASFAYFHGWRLASHMIEGYVKTSSGAASIFDDARLFAIVLALHQAGRAGPLGQPQRMEGAIRYLSNYP
jgi:aminoglycoside phosphotransferase (APT) family kinase protein